MYYILYHNNNVKYLLYTRFQDQEGHALSDLNVAIYFAVL